MGEGDREDVRLFFEDRAQAREKFRANALAWISSLLGDFKAKNFAPDPRRGFDQRRYQSSAMRSRYTAAGWQAGRSKRRTRP